MRTGGMSGQKKPKLLAVTACPTGIAHTSMTAEKLTRAARRPPPVNGGGLLREAREACGAYGGQ